MDEMNLKALLKTSQQNRKAMKGLIAKCKRGECTQADLDELGRLNIQAGEIQRHIADAMVAVKDRGD